ncbi:hypothetical protein FACS189472_07020 [Alphaproteobacteria bacterium]|nr:hypothetical protein FACS189472_07020 [Alphaproteobacteria bacterium]
MGKLKKLWLGVHDYYNKEKNEWVNVWHFHFHPKDILKLGRTENIDMWGFSQCFILSGEPDFDYESFRYGGVFYTGEEPTDFEKPGRVRRGDVEQFFFEHNGILVDT